jgi:hypothetical protein
VGVNGNGQRRYKAVSGSVAPRNFPTQQGQCCGRRSTQPQHIISHTSDKVDHKRSILCTLNDGETVEDYTDSSPKLLQRQFRSGLDWPWSLSQIGTETGQSIHS